MRRAIAGYGGGALPLQLASSRGPTRLVEVAAGPPAATVAGWAGGTPSVTCGATGAAAGAAGAVIALGRASSSGVATTAGRGGSGATAAGTGRFGVARDAAVLIGRGSGGLGGSTRTAGAGSGGRINATSIGLAGARKTGGPTSASAAAIIAPCSTTVPPAATNCLLSIGRIIEIEPGAALIGIMATDYNRAIVTRWFPMKRLVGLLALVGVLAGCAGGLAGLTERRVAPPERLRGLVGRPPSLDFALLGEIHDNPAHHRQRLAWLEELARGGRFALALEQLDADRQAAIDAARAGASDARALAQQGGFDFKGWDWRLYGPYVELALRYELPLIAANLTNADARRIARNEPDAPRMTVEAPGWGERETGILAEQIRNGHCNMLPERAIVPMSTAQRVRDARIARALVDARRATGLPVVLLAGNGHVRRDVGVPRYLSGAMPDARLLVVGFVEREDADVQQTRLADRPDQFDQAVTTAPHPRSDPCEQLKGLRARAEN